MTKSEPHTAARTSPRIALVTGASRGIGQAIAAGLAQAGFDLMITARTASALETVADHLGRETGSRIDMLAGDLREPAFAEALVTEADWQDGFALKFFGTVRLCRAAWPYLQVVGGQIVNIIGAGGRTPSAEFTIGGSVNAGLMNLTKALADQGLKDGVRVNGINPGAIRTDRLQTRIRRFAQEQGIDPEEAASLMVQDQRIMRFGEPEEIAAVVAFLAAGGTYLHGALIDVDGGTTKGL
jgi:NAD(P)-dependent dehydrogenase (short-subunit alcohol dehydrogenase family)